MKTPENIGLNEDTYHWLSNRTPYKPADDEWFKISYSIFSGRQAPKLLREFYELIAFAYSWMPTIPNVKAISPEDWSELKIYISRLESLKEDELSVLLEKLIPKINNSIVGTSKVLHFISPNNIPIIDSRVLKAWRKTFEHNKELYLTNNLLSAKNPIKVIQNYLKYRRHLIEWKSNCNSEIGIRDIESAFYYQVI
ncbi:MAG: hypothetical protein J0L67_14705 [Cytophagales bacterium]|nr:hypothetical protein [Cytophagales bacterium]